MSAKPAGKPEKRGFDAELSRLEELAACFKSSFSFDPAQVESLRKLLGHRNNFLVSKAAKLVADAALLDLLPDALAAYERFFTEPEKTDPQCWAKNALVKTLIKLEHRQKDAYLRGLRHHQLEGTWGGTTDTAGTLRGECAQGLVNCPGLSDPELLALLLEPLVDEDKTVRMEAARAIGQVGGVSAALILRLRILIGPTAADRDAPEALGAVFAALLSVEAEKAIPLVAAALKEGDDLSAEAAYALADLRSVESLKVLQQRLNERPDAWFASVLLSAIAMTRLPEALDFLIAMIARDGRQAPMAIEAIGRMGPSDELCKRVRSAVEKTGSERLAAAIREHLPNA